MKDTRYIVLNSIYYLTKNRTNLYIPDIEILIKCSNAESKFLTILESDKFLNYQRIDKKDCYALTQSALDYILQYRKRRLNTIFTVIGTFASIGALVFSALPFLR